jgi:hypothetical protein
MATDAELEGYVGPATVGPSGAYVMLGTRGGHGWRCVRVGYIGPAFCDMPTSRRMGKLVVEEVRAEQIAIAEPGATRWDVQPRGWEVLGVRAKVMAELVEDDAVRAKAVPDVG